MTKHRDTYSRMVQDLLDQMEQGPALVPHRLRLEISHKGAIPNRATLEVMGSDAAGEVSRHYDVRGVDAAK